jgi:purine-nucleoside/S-methyl-5'-thioadenosine phosphorylase / adenosine deaminase
MATAALPELQAPFRWAGEHVAADLPGVRALFTTRRGGVSTGPFASLNLGRLTADDSANVDENRARVAAATGCRRERFLYGRQVHGAAVRRATEPPGPARPPAEEDGQATALAGHPALVFVADCTPVLLAADGAVAALHAGWRGIAAGIVAEGVAALRDCGGTGPVTALIGPGARSCCYEVGEEVHDQFQAYDARRGERNLDLPRIIRADLEKAGVTDVHDVGLCTMCWFGMFFSHRRDGGVTGRQAGVVWRA